MDKTLIRKNIIRIGIILLFAFILAAAFSGHMVKAASGKLEGLCYDPDDATKLNYYKNGKVDKSYTGFAKVNDGSTPEWWYVEKGSVTFKRNDILRGKANVEAGAAGQDAWWYIKNSKVTKATTVAENSYGWWYVRNGKVNFDYNGFAKNEHGWWYVEDGKVTFGKNDIIQGKANTDPSASGKDGWWYVRESKVTKATTVAKNKYGWWYVKNGKVDFNYNGFGKNSYGWWYLENGKVTFDNYDILQGTANTDPKAAGEDGWWYVRESKVIKATTVAQNKYGWWYVENGKVDFTYTGIKENEYGWWRIVEGKVDFSCNSVEENEYGWWRLVDGKVDFSFTGMTQRGSEWWYCKEGKAVLDYTGPVIYKSTGYHVVDGVMAQSYSGSYSGETTYEVEKGKIISGWVKFNGSRYYFTGSGKLAKETVTINGRKEVFRTNGKWIDTSKMDTKAADYGSSTNYLILVNTSARVTKIYKKSNGKWTVAQNYLCTVGDTSKGWDTIKGDFYVGYSSWDNPYTRGYSFEDTDNHTLYYWVRFCDSFLFHSQLYDLNTYNLTKSGNALGEELSHGCVRLKIDNAKWIYDNIPDGTRVIVY